jgi:hypothetical protein
MKRAHDRVCRAAAVIGLGGLGMFTGCECVAGLDDDVRLDPAGAGGGTTATSPNGTGGDASQGGGDDVGSVGSTGGAGQGGTGGEAVDCSVVGYPLPPPGDDAGGDVTFVVAVRSVLLDEQDGEPPPGLNLDRTCTCPGPSSCISEEADPDTLCDIEVSHDVQSARIFGQIALLTNDAFSSRELSQDAEIGKWSLLMRVEGWTGEADDPRVRFTMFPSPGVPDEDEAPPVWDGDDPWLVDASAVGPSGDIEDALFVDEAAYVVGNRVVASLPESGLILAPDESVLALKLSGAFLVATIEEDTGSYVLRDGILAAVWPTDGIFESLDGFRDGEGEPICTNDALFGLARDAVCETADMFDGVATPTSPCNAISVGIGFAADPAVVGEVVESPEPSEGCEPQFLPSTCKCDDDC